MDPQHETSDVTPDALDQELRAALNVEPSAFFATRVRARVAGESMSRSWRPAPLRFVGLASMVMLVGAIAGWLMQMPRTPDSGRSTRLAGAESMASPPRPPVASTASTETGMDGPVESSTAEPAAPNTRSRQIARPTASGGRRSVAVHQESFSREWLAAVDRGLVTVVIVQAHDAPRPMNSPSIALDVPPITIAPVIVEAIAPFAE